MKNDLQGFMLLLYRGDDRDHHRDCDRENDDDDDDDDDDDVGK